MTKSSTIVVVIVAFLLNLVPIIAQGTNVSTDAYMLVGLIRDNVGAGEFFIELTGFRGGVGANLTVPSGRVYNLSYWRDPGREGFDLNAEATNYLELAANFTDGIYVVTAYFTNGAVRNYTQTLGGQFPQFPSLVYPLDGSLNINTLDFIVRWQPIADPRVTDLALFIDEEEGPYERQVEEFLLPNQTSYAVEPGLLRLDFPYSVELTSAIFSPGGGIFNGFFNGSVKGSVNASFFRTMPTVIDKEGDMFVGMVRNRTGGGEFFVDITGLQGSVGANLTVPSGRVYNMSYDRDNLLDDYEFSVEADDYRTLQGNFTDGDYIATVYFMNGEVKYYAQRLLGPFPAFMSLTYPQNGSSAIDPYDFTITWSPITDPMINSLVFFISELEFDEGFSAFTPPNQTSYAVPPGILRLGFVPHQLEYGTAIFGYGTSFSNGVYNGSVKASISDLIFMTAFSSRLEPQHRIEMKSDQSTSSARIAGPGVPPYSVIRQLDRGGVGNVSFVPVDVGNFGSWIRIPQGAPAGTQIVNIRPAAFFAGQSGYFKLSFDLPLEFTDIHLIGRAAVDDVGRVFLNGQQLTPSIFSGSEYTIAMFDSQAFYTNNESMFHSGRNEILIADVNSNGLASAGAFYAIVRYNPPGLTITTQNIPPAVLGTFASNQFAAERGVPPYAWSIINGTPPLGMSLSPAGLYSGTPTEAGMFAFTVRVTDSNNTRAEKTFTHEVALTLPPPEVRVYKAGTTAVPGRMIDYFIAVENVGTAPAHDIVASEFIEPWFTFVSADPTPFNITNFTDIFPQNVTGTYAAYIEWKIPIVNPNEIRLLSYRVVLDSGIPPNERVRGEICLTCSEAIDCRNDLFYCIGSIPFICRAFPPPYLPCVAAGMIACEASWAACMHRAVGCPDQLEESVCNTNEQVIRQAYDPNEKEALANSFIQSNQTLPYIIHFENVGNAEAEDIFINDTLGPAFNIDTIKVVNATGAFIPLQNQQTIVLLETNRSRLINISIGNQTIIINRTHIEQWNVTLINRMIRWALSGIFLDVNKTDKVSYLINPVSNLPSGTEIRNKAAIQFEILEPITTNETLNIIDDTRPSCMIDPLPSETYSRSFRLSWNWTDQVGEIQSYNVFVSENNGPFRLFVNNTLAMNTTFTGSAGKAYGFTCIATDTAGNIEVQPPGGAEAVTRIPGTLLESIGTPRIGTTVNLSVFGLGYEGRKYVLAMSLGNSPGIPLGDGRVIPLNPDIIFLLSIQAGQLIGLRNNINFLNEQGLGVSYWDIPNVPELNGITVYAAFVVLDHTLPIPFASISNAVPITPQ